ncbi:hypothetical protein [Actinocorallia libanotica]|uniref:Uncharacterized protein n=1 Tax=Actinocorallia libanotica TaxID=46162 RepID=A0ABP4CGW3_9ACTN
MSRIAKLAAVGASAAAVVAMTATSASAWTGGSVTGTLTAPLTVKVLGSNVASCTTSTLNGSVTTADKLTISTAAISGCTGSGTVTVAAEALPWANGTLTTGGGTASFNGFRVKANATLLGFPVTCIYAGTITGTNTAASGSPLSTTVTFTNASVSKQSGSSGACPGTAQVSAQYKFQGAGL